jgi:hypothetical protein
VPHFLQTGLGSAASSGGSSCPLVETGSRRPELRDGSELPLSLRPFQPARRAAPVPRPIVRPHPTPPRTPRAAGSGESRMPEPEAAPRSGVQV